MMKTTVTKRPSEGAPSANNAVDDKMRKFLRRVFPENSSISGLPTVREFFAALFDRYGERLQNDEKPRLDRFEVTREMMFLRNIDTPVTTIQNRSLTLWDLFTESKSVVIKMAPPIDGHAAKNIAVFQTRVAEYVHRIRTARKAPA